MDVIIELADAVLNFIGFLLVIALIVLIFFRPLLYSYHLSPDGIDIMLLSAYKLYRINFRDITDIRVGGYISEIRTHNLKHFRRTKIVLDKLYPRRVMVVTTTNGKIRYWILSTTHLEYIRDHVNGRDTA
jgi:hypothetical protein